MPFDDPDLYLHHVLASIGHIEEFVAGMDFAAYQADLKTRSAIERQILILSEAAYRLGDRAQVLVPDVDWRSIRGMGNRLRHGYDHIHDQTIWDTERIDLPPLKASAETALPRLAKGPGQA